MEEIKARILAIMQEKLSDSTISCEDLERISSVYRNIHADDVLETYTKQLSGSAIGFNNSPQSET